MILLFLFKKKKQKDKDNNVIQLDRSVKNPFSSLNNYIPLSKPEYSLYESIREGIPIVDSAILKIVRLVGGFEVIVSNKKIQKQLDLFLKNVNVGGINKGVECFIANYLDDLLMYGNAIGEIVLQNQNTILGLYNADVKNISVKPTVDNPLEVDFYINSNENINKKIENKNLLMFTALNPKSSEYTGVSMLSSLPFVSKILLQIYNSIGTNFERIGNIRYAVTYKPGSDSMDKVYAKERASLIAKEWSDGMKSLSQGCVKDFVTIGDVDIKVIGADNQIIDTEIPAKHMLEQIVAQIGIPPFLLGLSWSTTERMSEQQTNLLTTELEFYRRLLSPVILKIARTYLRLNGYYDEPQIKWNTINFKDEVEQAQAKLYNAQADEIINQNTERNV